MKNEREREREKKQFRARLSGVEHLALSGVRQLAVKIKGHRGQPDMHIEEEARTSVIVASAIGKRTGSLFNRVPGCRGLGIDASDWPPDAPPGKKRSALCGKRTQGSLARTQSFASRFARKYSPRHRVHSCHSLSESARTVNLFFLITTDPFLLAKLESSCFLREIWFHPLSKQGSVKSIYNCTIYTIVHLYNSTFIQKALQLVWLVR